MLKRRLIYLGAIDFTTRSARWRRDKHVADDAAKLKLPSRDARTA
jgi:hypothetical protein